MASLPQQSGRKGISFDALIDSIEEATKTVSNKIDAMRGSEDMSIGDMFEMQMLMNKLTQLSEMSTSVVSASHQATMSMAQKISR